MARAAALQGEEKLDEAAQLYGQVYEARMSLLGARQEATAAAGSALGVVLYRLERADDADAPLTAAFDYYLERYGTESALTADAALALARVRLDRADYAAADALYAIEAEFARSTRVPNSRRRSATSEHMLTLCLLDRWLDAAEVIRESVAGLAAEFSQPGRNDTPYERRFRAAREAAVGQLLQIAGEEHEGAAALESASVKLAGLIEEGRLEGADRRELAQALSASAAADVYLGRTDEAEARLSEAIPLLEAEFGKGARASFALGILGACRLQTGDYAEAEKLLLEAYGRLRSDPRSRFFIARNLIELYSATDREDLAVHWRECLHTKPHREWLPPGAGPPDGAPNVPSSGNTPGDEPKPDDESRLMMDLDALLASAVRLKRQSDYERAEAHVRHVLEQRLLLLGDEHPSTVNAQLELADLLRLTDRQADAEKVLTAVYEERRRVLGDDNLLTLDVGAILAVVRFEQADYASAAALYELRGDGRCASTPVLWRGGESQSFAPCCPLFVILQFQMRWAEAADLLRECVALRAPDPDRPSKDPYSQSLRAASDDAYYGRLLRLAHLEAEAAEAFERAAHGFEQLLAMLPETGDAHVARTYARRDYGFVLAHLGRLEEAEERLRAVILEFDAPRHRAKPWRRGWAVASLGDCLLRAGRHEEAEAHLLAAHAALALDWPNRLYVALRLIDLYDQTGRSTEAEHWRTCVASRPLREWGPPSGAQQHAREGLLQTAQD